MGLFLTSQMHTNVTFASVPRHAALLPVIPASELVCFWHFIVGNKTNSKPTNVIIYVHQQKSR